jgi:hypothetical protein
METKTLVALGLVVATVAVVAAVKLLAVLEELRTVSAAVQP